MGAVFFLYNTEKTLVLAASSDYVVYDDYLKSSWSNWSWGSNVNLGNLSPVLSGSSSISIAPNSWGALYLHTDSALDASSYTDLNFSIKASQSNQKFGVFVYDANNQATRGTLSLDGYGGQPDTGSWKNYKIPLLDLNAVSRQIKGIAIQEITGVNQPAVFVDSIFFGASVVQVPAPVINPSVASLGDINIYNDSLVQGWNNWSWGSNVNFGATNTVFSGSNSISFTPNLGWSALYLHTESAVNASSYKYLNFAIRTSGGSPKLGVFLYDANNQVVKNILPLDNYGGQPVVGFWKTYSLPLSDINPSGTQIKGVAIQEVSGSTVPAVYFDSISISVNPFPNNSQIVIPTSTPVSGGIVTTPIPTPTPTSVPVINGFKGEYFDNIYLSGQPRFTRVDQSINFDWGGGSPVSGLPSDNYSVRWTGNLSSSGGNYNFVVWADDGVRLFVDGKKVIDKWIDQAITSYGATVNLTAGAHTVVMEYYEKGGNAAAKLNYTLISGGGLPGSSPTPTQVPVVPPSGIGGAGYIAANNAIYKSGSVIKMKGVNWFGFETGTHAPHGLWARNWKDMINQMKGLGFNAVRVPVCPATLQGSSVSSIDYSQNQDLQNLNSLQLLDKVLGELNNQKMHILLDHHTPDCNVISDLWYTSSYNEQAWINDLVAAASRYKNLEYFMGIDIKNEPHGTATWGTGNSGTDWNTAAEKAGKAVLGTNPNLLIFVQGVQENPSCSSNTAHWMGGNLEPQACKPISTNSIPSNKLVFSPHVYGPDVYPQGYFFDSNFPNNMAAIWEKHFGYLLSKGYTIVPGEWGGRYGTSGNVLDKTLQDSLVNYFKSKGVYNSFYWSWNPNSGDTGGILQDDWKTPWSSKLILLKDYYGF